MGTVIRFNANRPRRPVALPVALTEAWAAYCFECSAAWWRWVLTGR
nr:hypothetical protein [Dechloromonas sp.]